MNDTTNLKQVHTIYIDSKYRDLQAYPNANYFVFEFDSTIKDISSVELSYMLFFNNTTDTSRYMRLNIPELEQNIISNINNDSFAHLPLFNYAPGFVEHTRARFTICRVYEPRMQKLSKITIDIRDENGDPLRID